jgi:hypothetical protein
VQLVVGTSYGAPGLSRPSTSSGAWRSAPSSCASRRSWPWRV